MKDNNLTKEDTIIFGNITFQLVLIIIEEFINIYEKN